MGTYGDGIIILAGALGGDLENNPLHGENPVIGNLWYDSVVYSRYTLGTMDDNRCL